MARCTRGDARVGQDQSRPACHGPAPGRLPSPRQHRRLRRPRRPIEVAPADRLSLSVTGPFAAHAPGDERDLAWRAARLLLQCRPCVRRRDPREEEHPGRGRAWRRFLRRGGGAPRTSTSFLGRICPAEELRAIGLTLGADVPMCLAARRSAPAVSARTFAAGMTGRRCRWCSSGRGWQFRQPRFLRPRAPRQSSAARAARRRHAT